jgi:hypothetical protein
VNHTPLLHLLACKLRRPVIRFYDPTGGDPFLGGPVWWAVCAHCQERLTGRRAERALAYALRAARYREARRLAGCGDETCTEAHP